MASIAGKVRRLQIEDRAVFDFLSAIADKLDLLTAIGILDARLVEAQSFTGGTNKAIDHGLGREPRGWWVTNQSAAGAQPHLVSKDSLTLTLLTAGTYTADLWVF